MDDFQLLREIEKCKIIMNDITENDDSFQYNILDEWYFIRKINIDNFKCVSFCFQNIAEAKHGIKLINLAFNLTKTLNEDYLNIETRLTTSIDCHGWGGDEPLKFSRFEGYVGNENFKTIEMLVGFLSGIKYSIDQQPTKDDEESDK